MSSMDFPSTCRPASVGFFPTALLAWPCSQGPHSVSPEVSLLPLLPRAYSVGWKRYFLLLSGTPGSPASLLSAFPAPTSHGLCWCRLPSPCPYMSGAPGLCLSRRVPTSCLPHPAVSFSFQMPFFRLVHELQSWASSLGPPTVGPLGRSSFSHCPFGHRACLSVFPSQEVAL